MDLKGFKPVSTGKKISSVLSDPELTLYPKIGRVKLTPKALELLGDKITYVTVFADSEYNALVFIKDNERKFSRGGKVDEHCSFASAETVRPIGLIGNTVFKDFEVISMDQLNDEFPSIPAVVFKLKKVVEETNEKGETMEVVVSAGELLKDGSEKQYNSEEEESEENSEEPEEEEEEEEEEED